jgi:hypothetical protein
VPVIAEKGYILDQMNQEAMNKLIILGENQNLRLQLKMAHIQIKEMQDNLNHRTALEVAHDVFSKWMQEHYGVTIHDGKLVYLDSGNELPLANRKDG